MVCEGEQTMTLQELRDKINAAFSVSTVQVYFVLRSERELELRLADIESGDTTTEIKAMFCSYINDLIVNNEALELCELSTADERQGAIYRYDYEEYPEELGLLKNFNIDKAVNKIKKFDFSEDDLGKLFGYIIYLGSMYNGIVLFKKHYQISLIKRDSFLLGAIKSNRRFERVTDDIIRLNGVTQMFCVDNEIFVIDLKAMKQNSGFSQLILKSAGDTIQAINDLSLIEDIQALKDAVEDSSFALKLSKIKKSSPIFKLNIPKEAIIEFTKTNPALTGKFKYSEDESMLRLDTKKSKELFIKLMNDAFLHSELTKQYYEAKAKDNITQEA